jgi:malonyl-CoA/methylmalonyl-CoA synthetase
VLHFWGFTLHTGEIERALFSLPYIANAVVLPLEDEECQERAAAILQIKPFELKKPVLAALRNDLTEKTGLMLFKQPTVVYWLQEGEEITLTVNGKISKRDARKKFFGDRWQCREGVEILDLKELEYWRMGGQC